METIKELLVEKDLGIRFDRYNDLCLFAEMLQSVGMRLFKDGISYGSIEDWPIRGIPPDDNANKTLVCGCSKEIVISFEEFCALVQADEEEVPDNSGMEDLI